MVGTRTLVASQPFSVETRYDDSLIPARFTALEDDGEFVWTVVEWPGATHTVMLEDGSFVSVEDLTEEVE